MQKENLSHDSPQIHLWYGKRQRFGHVGRPQRWVNVLGRVRGQFPLHSLDYTLNGGDLVKLTIGPDLRRLAGKGDFNIDLDCGDLHLGDNHVEIIARDVRGNQSVESVIVEYADEPCPLPLDIDWRQVRSIDEVGHVTDGIWSLVEGGVSPVEIGYDRLIAIGEMGWRDYQVTVPITVHAIHAACYNRPSVHAGVGIVMRWKGHSNWGEDQWASGQPRFGPSPYGAIGWYCVFHDDGPILNLFDPRFQRPVQLSYDLPLHVPHIFKVRVETLADQSSLFSLKVWRADAHEPASWTLQAPGTPVSLKEGALLLGAHHTAATFGNVLVEPVPPA
ncbi:MAG: hypothetical protein HC802_21335 [Caldilineaceae bacterium]|nr:hypothetical protein [Caldilineaceae bacterium]